MEKARRPRHVPAFGEWNYYYHYDEPELPPPSVALECYSPEPEACSDVWFKYSPPPRKPAPKKVRRQETPEKGRRARRAYDAGGGPARAPTRGGCRTVRPVDADLYQVPPPEFDSYRPRRKKAVRSLWMGCFGINCVA